MLERLIAGEHHLWRRWLEDGLINAHSTLHLHVHGSRGGGTRLGYELRPCAGGQLDAQPPALRCVPLHVLCQCGYAMPFPSPRPVTYLVRLLRNVEQLHHLGPGAVTLGGAPRWAHQIRHQLAGQTLWQQHIAVRPIRAVYRR